MKLRRIGNKAQSGAIILGVVIVIAIVASVAIIGALGGGGLFALGRGRDDDGGTRIETSDTTPTLSAICIDRFNKGRAVTCAWTRYKINDGAIKTDSDNQIEVNCGDKVEGLINATAHYTQKVLIESITCEENPEIAVEMLNYDISPDLQLFNQDDSLLNDATNTEALGANDISTLVLKLFPSYQNGIQDAHFFVNLKGANIDKITSSLGVDVGKPKSVTHNTTARAAGASGDADEMFVFEIGDIGDQAIETWTITMDIGGTAFGIENATIGILDKGYFVDFKGNFIKDFQDEDNNDLEQDHHAHDEAFFTAST